MKNVLIEIEASNFISEVAAKTEEKILDEAVLIATERSHDRIVVTAEDVFRATQNIATQARKQTAVTNGDLREE